MIKYCAALLFLAGTVQSAEYTVQLRNSVVPFTSSNLLVVATNLRDGLMPYPLEMLGESYVDILKKAETVVAASIVEVIPFAITQIDECYVNHQGPVFWYRVKCEIKAVIRGRFQCSTMEFITCFGPHRNVWPYVRGFTYHFGMSKKDGCWVINSQVRACPIFPYKIEDHASYYDMKKLWPTVDQARWDLMVNSAYNSSTRLLDVSVEKNQYLIMTFEGSALLAMGLNLEDYGRSVSIRVWSLATGTQLEFNELPNADSAKTPLPAAQPPAIKHPVDDKVNE